MLDSRGLGCGELSRRARTFSCRFTQRHGVVTLREFVAQFDSRKTGGVDASLAAVELSRSPMGVILAVARVYPVPVRSKSRVSCVRMLESSKYVYTSGHDRSYHPLPCARGAARGATRTRAATPRR